MTYWMTLWYAGAVVLTMGWDGLTYEECEEMRKIALEDIILTYTETPELMQDTMFPTNEFEVTCETEQLPIDKRYIE